MPVDSPEPGAADAGRGAGTGGGDVLDSADAGALLIRGGTIRFAGYAGGVGLSVVSAAVLTRYLGVSRFGQYTTIMSLVAVVAWVTDAGMSTIGAREYAVRQGSDRERFIRDLLGLRVAMTLLGVVLTAAFTLAAGYDNALLLGAVAASLATVALVFQHTLSIPLMTELRLGLLSGLELARQTLWTAGIVGLVAIGAGVFPLLSIPLLINVVLILPTARLVRGQIRARLTLHPSALPALLRDTVVFSLATAVGTIYVFAAQIITSLVTTPRQSGLFAVSFRVFIVCTGVPGLLVGAALPLLSRAARDDRDRLVYALQRIFETSLIGGVGVSLILSAGSGFVVSVVAGSRYAAAASILEIQSLALIASFLTAGWSFGLLSLRLHRGLLAANGAALFVSIVLTLVLATRDGARGAAVATICGETTLAITSLLALVRGRPAYRPESGVMIKVAASAIAAALASFEVSMPSIVRAIVAAAVYGSGILATRALPSELSQLLFARRRQS